MRDVDIIGRYGGEEFAVILPNTNFNGAYFVAERLRKNFEKLIIQVNEEEGIKITLSIGVSNFPLYARDIRELVKSADEALYFAKMNGKNNVKSITDLKMKNVQSHL